MEINYRLLNRRVMDTVELTQLIQDVFAINPFATPNLAAADRFGIAPDTNSLDL